MTDYDPTRLKNFVEGARRALTEGARDPNLPRAAEPNYGGGDEGFGSGAPPDYRPSVEADDADEELDESADDGTEESEFYEAPGATAQKAWDALSDAEQQAALNNPAALDKWTRALADEQPVDQDEEAPIRTGADFVGFILGSADADGMVEGEDGSTVSAADYLAAIAGMSTAEWRSWAEEIGVDPESRPTETDWPRDWQSSRIADRFSDRLAAIKEAEAEGRPRANIPYL